MTPFTEILEQMSWRLSEVGGVCMNAESEIEAIGMTWGAAATGFRAATGSVGQGLSLMQESISEAALAQLPFLIFNMARSQADYFQATRGGGHGDYRTPVLAPQDAAEAMKLIPLGFDIADRWRNPVLIYGDYYLAHTASTVDIPEAGGVTVAGSGSPEMKEWALDGSSGGTGKAKLISFLGDSKRRDGVGYDLADYYHRMGRHWLDMAATIQPLYEEVYVDDADVVITAFGSPAKFVRYVVDELRDEGKRVGFLRPITLFPFPSDAFRRVASSAKELLVWENNSGQMIDDVRLAVGERTPVKFIGGLTMDSSAFGIGPGLEVGEIHRRVVETSTELDK